MARFIGFSTINACKSPKTNALFTGNDLGVVFSSKFRLTDQELVIRDLINALNIRPGTKVGQPGYGTTIWDILFEPNTEILQEELDAELRRVASEDPRIIFNQVRVSRNNNIILAELQLAIRPFNDPFIANIKLDINTNTASLA
jgi:phage baseplate assembly protein W